MRGERAGRRETIVRMTGASSIAAAVGVAEHGNSAVLVTVAADGRLIDRRRVDLTHGLPTHPYHHEGSWAVGRYASSPWARPITLPEAIALVERVRDAAARGACEALDSLAKYIDAPIASIALRVCSPLPPTIEGCIVDARAATLADSILYRQALAAAAEARGWRVCWFDRDRVMREANAAILRDMGRAAGPPWQAKHKLAAAAALASFSI